MNIHIYRFKDLKQINKINHEYYVNKNNLDDKVQMLIIDKVQFYTN